MMGQKRAPGRFARAALAAAVVALGLVGSVGCWTPPDIDRTQPNRTPKSIFDGEWYVRSTVVDKQYHTSYPFIGSEGGLERVRWDVQQNQLVGYRSYDRTPGSDPSNPGDQVVVVAFPIISHFDVRRDYNPVNGVESNVIVENQDRQWNERDFIRVDWSRNLATGSAYGDIGAMIYDSAGNVVTRNANNDPKDPWKVRIENDYIETTIDATFMPDDRACYLLDPMSPCNGASVRLKISMKKVDTTSDYEPMAYPDVVPLTFGTMVDAALDDAKVADGTEIINTTQSTVNSRTPRACSREEMGPDGTAVFSVYQRADRPDLAGFHRLCNKGVDFADDCVDTVVRCKNVREIWTVDSAIPTAEGIEGDELCDPSIHNPDSCFQRTIPMFSQFGFFRTDRYLNDRENGFTLDGRERLINRWNVWKKSRDDNGAVIPLAQREVKPIVYHLNVGFPEPLLPAAQVIAKNWDTAFRNMVASTRGVDISEVPEGIYQIVPNSCSIASVAKYIGDHGDLEIQQALTTAGIDQVAVGNLENACAVVEHVSSAAYKGTDKADQIFHWEQLGDLRHSFLNWTTKAELGGPLGYGPSASDPITGEIISANANVYGTSLDTYANWGADVVDLINGKIDTGDVINGTNVRKHLEAVRKRWREELPEADVKAFEKLFDERSARMSTANYLKTVPLTSVNANLDRLAASGFESEHMLTSDMVKLFGGDPAALARGETTQSMLDKAMPTSWARTAIPDAMLNARPADIDTMATTGAERLSAAERLEQRADLFGRHNFCFLAEQAEPGIAALAAELAVKPLADDQKALTRDELVAYIRAQVFIGVTAHEVGHTLGLRHNFEGSADPLNFFPNFWGVDTGDHRMSENGRNHEVQYSTIMDYMQRFNSDFGGIGLYDKAAIKFGYGGKVEVFDEREEHFVPSDSYWDRNLDLFDPTDLPFLLAGNGANAELDRHYDGVYNSYVDGNDNAEINVQGGTNIQPKPANLFRRRDIDVKDWMKQEMLRVVGQNNDDGAPVSIAVPYKYCSDAFAYGGNLKCNRWDMGTTSSEIVKNAAEMYDFYYPFDAFRRDRASNGWASGYMNRVYSRTYQPMLNAFRYFYYYRRSGARIWPEIKDWSKASLSGMNFFLRVLSTPEPGEYCLDNGNYVPKASAATCEKTVTLGIDQARFYDTSYDVNQEYRPNNMGHFYDKGLAIMAMTDTNAFFLRDFSNLTNRSAFSIGYYRVFAPEMIKLYGGLIRGENEVYSSRIVDGPSGPEVVPPRFLGAGTGTIENPAAGNRVPPSDSFQLRNWALFYAMGNLSTPLDQTLDFASRARITLAGSASDPTTAIDPSKVVEFTDPVSHYIYRAVAVDGPEQSIGFTLLTDAKTFAAGPWQAAKAALAAAEASPATDDDGPAQAAFQRANARLNDKLGMIDNVRRLGDAYGAGAN